MPDLKTAITIVEIIIGVAVAMVLGDLLGNRVGRVRFAIAMGVIVLIAIVSFVVYAAIVLARS